MTEMENKTMEKPYPALKVQRKTGSELFHKQGTPANFDVLSFWGWAVSNVASNNLRGHLAEYLVARELGLDQGIRREWDSCDIRTPSGVQIEVKSASYIQTWAQDNLSRISFDIAPARKWDSKLGRRSNDATRNSHVFVFCLIVETDQNHFDPLDLDQWKFFVLRTEKLNEALGSQKQLSLSTLRKLHPIECSYGDVGKAISTALNH